MKAYYPTTNKTSSSSSSNRQQHHNPLLNSVPNHHQPFGNNNTVLMPGPNPITAMFNQAAVAAMLNPFPGFNPTHQQQQQQALHHNQQQQSVNHRHHSHHQSSSGSSHHHHHQQQQQTHGNYVNYYTSNADGIRQYNPNNNHHHHHQNHNSHYNNNAQAHSGHHAKNDKIMKPEKILYSKALQGSSMSSQNSGQNINSGNIVANNPPNVIVAPTGATLSSQGGGGGGGGGGGVAITSSNSNEPGSNSYHHLHRSPNSGGHYGSERSGGGGGGRNMNPNNSNNNLPPRMAKNYQSIYPIRHDQPYSEYRISSRTNPQQSSAPPSTTSVSTASVNVQQQQQANKVSTNGSTSIVSPISTLSNNSTNNNTVSSIGTINNPSSVSSNNTTNNNSSTTNGGVSGTGGTSISDKSDSSMANHHNSNTTISKTNLYIRGLTPDTTDKDLHSLCQLYGTIVSTKAILDKETNKCRGYGFVDFDNPLSAETAVKNLNEQGVQAQMAKCTDTSRNKNLQPKISLQEHDPTNLYIANLPISMTEMDLESMLSIHGKVVSTRILKDVNNASRGVGFARMESKDECDIIIDKFNGKLIPGCRDLLLVKFADGGGKKKNHYKNESRYRNDVDQLQMTFDSTNLTPNGVTAAMLPSPLGAQAYNQRFSSPYQNPLQPNPWMNAPAPQPQYIMQPPPMLTSNMDPNALQYAGPLMHQLTAQLHNIQLGGGTGFMPGNPHPYGTQLYPTQLIPTMPMSGVGGDQDPINPSHSVSSGSVSGEEQQQQQQQNQQASQQAPPSHSFQMCYNQQK